MGFSGRQERISPDRLLHGCSFFPCVPPTYPFHHHLPRLLFIMLIPLLPCHCFVFVTIYQPCLICHMSACLFNSRTPSLLPVLPLPAHLCLFFSLPISLARWIGIAQSTYYEQINVVYGEADRLSPWQHMRENFRMFQAD